MAVASQQDQKKKFGALIVDVEGTSLTAEDQEVLLNEQVGGVIFFARNFTCPKQMLELTGAIRALRPELLLTVDQEGGRVQRFLSGMSRLPSFARLADAGQEACEELAWLMAREILELDIDLSFTPVLDINYGRNQVIGDRAFGSNANAVVQCAAAYLNGMNRAGMKATGKHFPGHGWVELDSHVALPVDERAYDVIAEHDMSVFKSLAPQLSAMMTAHVLYPEIDDTIATYSKKWIRTLIDDVKFKGVIISDDFAMEGAAGKGSVVVRAQTAMQAGCHSLLMCNNRQAVLELLDSSEAWMSDVSLSCLKGNTGRGYESLSEDPEYQRIHQRWQMLLE